MRAQGEAAMSTDTLGMPGAQRSVAFCVHSWVQVTPPAPAGQADACDSPKAFCLFFLFSSFKDLSTPSTPATNDAHRGATGSRCFSACHGPVAWVTKPYKLILCADRRCAAGAVGGACGAVALRPTGATNNQPVFAC